ncbi:MAG: hypothetical protein FD189_1839 [Elusimicrobia bacterium]|nr:MAG: hypothetical protein FD154_2016 [Elusimicrobiota bacterium]KAF0154517.1 MAG: hypothetical protein FD189_1839 [Elusimicrobiota bacterium]
MKFAPKFTITNTITAGLAKIERARGFLDAARLSKDWITEMQNRALVLEAHHTTHIEGTQLTLEQSRKLLSGKKVPGADPDDTRELLNYRDAFELVAGYLDSGDPITEGLIREIHKRLVKGVRGEKAAPGAYRKVQNYVVNSKTGRIIHTPPAPDAVPGMMAELAAWLRSEHGVNPVLESGIAQFQLVHIHPFVDGNGRTSRLLSTLCLYRKGYDFKRLFTISEYYDRNRASFYGALQSVRETGMDITCWLEYFVEALATQMREIQERGEVVIRRAVILARARETGIKERPLALLAFVLKHGKGTLAECETALKKNRRTIQRDLKMLVDKGYLRAVGSGPTDPTKFYEPLL